MIISAALQRRKHGGEEEYKVRAEVVLVCGRCGIVRMCDVTLDTFEPSIRGRHKGYYDDYKRTCGDIGVVVVAM